MSFVLCGYVVLSRKILPIQAYFAKEHRNVFGQSCQELIELNGLPLCLRLIAFAYNLDI